MPLTRTYDWITLFSGYRKAGKRVSIFFIIASVLCSDLQSVRRGNLIFFTLANTKLSTLPFCYVQHVNSTKRNGFAYVRM